MTTARQVYESVLVELNKTEAPSFLLEDFNYLINKSIYQYINKRYNVYDANQQSTDDMRVLKSTAILLANKLGKETYLPPEVAANIEGFNSRFHSATYEVNLPNDYLHLLNCMCYYKVHDRYKCYNDGDIVEFPAKRLTADIYPMVVNNAYLKPSYKNPYFYIHNVNINSENPTNPYDKVKRRGTDIKSVNDNNLAEGGLERTIVVGKKDVDAVERIAEVRYGNKSPVRMEVRYGTDDSVFELSHVSVDYIKTPQHIRLTQEQIELTKDESQVLEFPDNVCQEIVNELVHIMLENQSDPRMQSHPVFSQSIANPAQQEQQGK